MGAPATEQVSEGNPAPPPGSKFGSLEKDCAWRETSGCREDGPRVSDKDKSCADQITANHSGFCDCDGDGVQAANEPGYDCSSTPGTCSTVCQEAVGSSSADNSSSAGNSSQALSDADAEGPAEESKDT